MRECWTGFPASHINFLELSAVFLSPELQLGSIPSGDVCYGKPESGGEHALQRHADIQGMDPTSGSGETDLGSLLTSGGGSVRVNGAQFFLRSVDVPLSVDAFAHVWLHVMLYAFPPLALVPPTLARVRDQGHKLILVAVHWPVMHWLVEILYISIGTCCHRRRVRHFSCTRSASRCRPGL